MPTSALAPARSSSAISRSAWTRLGLAIQDDALVEGVAEHAPRIQMRVSPRVQRARNDIAVKSAPGHGSVRLVVIQQPLADHEKVVIAFCSMVPTRAAPEQDDRAGLKAIDETADRLGESGIVYRPVLHTKEIYRTKNMNPIVPMRERTAPGSLRVDIQNHR